jgi:uncharacterized protein YgbK (DUF1537 family)
MCQIGIIADDLSGALDAAAPFASGEAPISVTWGGTPPARVDFAVDSETRHTDPDTAAQTVASLLGPLAGCDIAFKKVDSLMRGNTLPELLACCRDAAFGSVVIAPAFPSQGRVTRGGRQFAKQAERAAWRLIDADIPTSLADQGIEPRLLAIGAEIGGGGVLVCDAESDADLAAIAAAAESLAQPILWCGTAGLARALSGAPAEHRALRSGGRLAIIGSLHETSLRQLARLEDTLGEIAWVRCKEDAEPAVAAIGARLDRDGRAALAFAMPPLPPAGAEAIFLHTFALLARMAAPATVVAAGGDTVYRLCGELQATRIETIGEHSPGIAVSRFTDGAWAGAGLVSKSGAFGDDGLLARFMAR